MKSSKIIVSSLLSIIFIGLSILNVAADNTPQKKSLTKTTATKIEKKQPTIVYSQEEEKFIEEIDAYYTKKYMHALNLVQSKVEKVVVVDASGNVLQEISVTDHKEHEAKLPVGAEKLMLKGNTAYYVVLN